MQGLKLLVIAMGVLIVIGVAVIVVTVVNRVRGVSGRSFDQASLVLPKGCHVAGIATAGARLALELGDGPECQLILFVDPESGRETGRLSLLAQP
jgi:hypothetical protein